MKLNYQKKWFECSALREGDAEVGAGIPPTHSPIEPTLDKTTTPFETRIAFGQFVALWRRNSGWNAEQLAAEAGIDTEEILEIEHDPHCEPEADAVHKLASVFGVPSNRMMELAGLIQARTPHLREEAIRFAASSEPLSALSEAEQQALEAFVGALTS
jgi:transcriptional regulator with XRE-family HTH domain